MSNWNLDEAELPGIEPRITYFDSKGHRLDEAELKTAKGPIRWTFRDEDQVPPQAIRVLNDGMASGAAARFERAMEQFRQAHKIAPRWAQPVYQGAWTALLMADVDLAEMLYVWTDRMVPRGYWTAKSARDCLARERLGEFPHGLYLRYVLLEGSERASRTQALEEIVSKHPSFAPAWKDLSVLRESKAGRDEAIASGLAASPDAETRGFLGLHRIQRLQEDGQVVAAEALLKELHESESTTLQVAALVQMMLRCP
jgi:hypothetical protein